MTDGWERDGFVAAVDVLTPAEVIATRARFDALEARVGRDTAEIRLHDRHFDEPWIWQLATDPRIVDPVTRLIGSDVLLLGSHFFCKYPAEERGERFVAWHQDLTYWGLEPPLALSAWLAIDDADVANGCMRVIPGSHGAGLLTHGTASRPGNLLSINQEVPADLVDERRAVSLPLAAGQMSLHHGLLLHQSHPNRSSRRRCGLTLRYVPATVRQTAANSLGTWWRAALVRGEDRHGHWSR
jgi:ectoine hydroxylase-related dioxygenase (phytanoyl-CoA dioxygenase family)